MDSKESKIESTEPYKNLYFWLRELLVQDFWTETQDQLTLIWAILFWTLVDVVLFVIGVACSMDVWLPCSRGSGIVLLVIGSIPVIIVIGFVWYISGIGFYPVLGVLVFLGLLTMIITGSLCISGHIPSCSHGGGIALVTVGSVICCVPISIGCICRNDDD